MTGDRGRGDDPRLASVLERLAGMPSRLAAVAGALDPRARIGDWGAREVVLHLAAVEEVVWQARLRDLAAADDPVWSWIEPGVASAPGDDTLGGALAIFRSRREATLATVVALSPTVRGRSGTHATYGRLDLVGLLAVAADHDEHHLVDLRSATTRAGPGGAAPGA